MSIAESKNVYSQYADFKANNISYPTTASGEAMILANNGKGNASKLVFVKGSIKNPIITRVIVVDKSVDNIYSSNYLTGLCKNGRHYNDTWGIIEEIAGREIFIEYTNADFETFSEIKQQRSDYQSGYQGGSRIENR